MTLGPLDYNDIAALLRDPVPNAGKDLVRRIYELSEDEPYFAEELARSVVERGPDGDPETAVTLRSAVLERVATLRKDERDIVERAAVLGSNFAPAARAPSHARRTSRRRSPRSGDRVRHGRRRFTPWASSHSACIWAATSCTKRTSRSSARASRASRAENVGIDSWIHLANAYELAGDDDAARATLRSVGAVAELARFDARRPPKGGARMAPTADLTRREEQIAGPIAAGLSTRQVGERLAIGKRTVETHLVNVYAKLGINSRSELADAIGRRLP